MVANLLGTNATNIARGRKYISRLLLGLLWALLRWLLGLLRTLGLLGLLRALRLLLTAAFALGEITLQPLGSLITVLLAGQFDVRTVFVRAHLSFVVALRALLRLNGQQWRSAYQSERTQHDYRLRQFHHFNPRLPNTTVIFQPHPANL
ncbi:MAG TPA: hypothetical protein P5102_10900 [Candidatus Competibacteraceae bacterium]|nr:hypothetical protein [Candidatus Competibacteraceae bacterium]HRZ06637.1 hypothetical protein [Candidatus Competibacteraceae bacterium]HSA47309.1 hypothetical protein [Candidatus Competibacteraceae bacterium]